MTKPILLSALLLFAVSCTEDENPVRKAIESHHGEPIRADELHRSFDLDGDGMLDADELATHHEMMFAELDTDGDGALSAAEAASAPGPLAKHFAEVDSDGDGLVTETELAAAIEKHHGEHAR